MKAYLPPKYLQTLKIDKVINACIVKKYTLATLMKSAVQQGSGLIASQPEHDGCGDGDGGHEGVGASTDDERKQRRSDAQRLAVAGATAR